MKTEVDIEKRYYEILEKKGGKIAEETKKTLLKDIHSPNLKASLQYVVENWHDPLRPTLVTLSREAVDGESESITPAAIATSLIGLSLIIWNDLADGVKYRGFVPTFPQKLGEGTAQIIAGIATAKGYHLLSEFLQKEKSPEKYRRINNSFLDLACTMAEAEALNFSLRKRNDANHEDKINVFKMRSVHLRSCMEIGAIGTGSEAEITALADYGSLYGEIMELRDDLRMSLNFTFELADKIQRGTLPYTLYWMKDHSKKAEKLLSSLIKKQKIKPIDIKNVINRLFETGTIDHTLKRVNILVEEATKKIRMKNEPSQLLKFLVQAQNTLILQNLTVATAI